MAGSPVLYFSGPLSSSLGVFLHSLGVSFPASFQLEGLSMSIMSSRSTAAWAGRQAGRGDIPVFCPVSENVIPRTICIKHKLCSQSVALEGRAVGATESKGTHTIMNTIMQKHQVEAQKHARYLQKPKMFGRFCFSLLFPVCAPLQCL
jgi:hypothetical protein